MYRRRRRRRIRTLPYYVRVRVGTMIAVDAFVTFAKRTMGRVDALPRRYRVSRQCFDVY